jgi:hypothetical protein
LIEQDFKDLEEQYSAKMAAEVQRYQELFQEKEGMNRRYVHPPTDHLWCSLTLDTRLRGLMKGGRARLLTLGMMVVAYFG